MKPSLISHKSSLLFYCAFLSVTALLGSVNLLEAQTYTSVYGFSLYSGFPPANADGALPYGGVVVSGNVIYGTTFEGGTNGEGTIFAVNTDGTGFTNLHTFASLVPFPGGTNSDGAAPHARLLLSGNTLYGTTSAGGPGGYGTVFKLNTNGAGFTNLHVFSASFTDGAYPNAGLILSGSRLYGTSSMGGSGTYGTVFSLKTDGTGYTNVYNFTAFGDGAEPQGEVLLSGGTLYGTTSGGGTNKGMGVIFSVKTNGTSFKTLYTFAATGTKNTNSTGATPEAGLVIAGNTLYGTTHLGGTNGDGVVFSLHTDGSGYTKLHEFAHGASNGTYFTNADGAHPECTLVLAGSTLYGTTLDGGSNGLGTVFSIDASGSAFANNYIFEFIIDADFLNEGGINPYAGLTLSGNVLYGTSEIGGGYDGNVYALSGLVTAPVAPTITSTSPLPDGMLGTAYDQQLAATGGTLPYTWKIISGHLMAGLTLSTNGLISGTPTAGGTTNFTVTVTGNDGLSSTQDFSLVIIVPDTRIPTLTITSPVASQKWSNAVFTVHGKCSDNVAVAGVFISANSNGWSPASLDTSTNWSADVNLTPGTNTIFAYAVDTSGNVSVTNSVKLIYILSTTLTVSTNGRGTLTPNYNGANLQIGISYSMTAKASTGFGFVSWTDGLGGVITNGAILKFIMASNLDFVANFKDLTKPLLTITNPIKTGLKWSNDQFTVKGKCSDNVGVSNVWLSLNGAAWINPTLSGSNWLQLVTLVPGTNTFAAYAVDAAGNKSLTNTTKLIYVLTAPLVVSTNGRGTITPAYNGAHLQIGIGYSMTAKAAAGFGFVNWTDGLGGVITNGAILKFVMASNLDFVANFKDITKPTLTITAPVANQKWSNALFNVSGKCADNVAVSNVWLSLNGADWALTSLSGGSNWLQQVTLVPGTNSVSVYAEDAAGNVSLTNTVKLVYFPSEITLAGLWNLVQLQTPSQIFIDGDNNLQGGGSFSIGTGSFALDTNGTLSGALGDPFTGAYLADSNGVVSVTITNSSGTQPIVFYANASLSTMTEIGSALDTNDNYQEIVVAQRVPPFVTIADVAGSWNLLQFKTPAQISFDTLNGLQDSGSFTVTNGTLTLNVNGTFSGKLNNSVTGTYTLGTNGLLTLHASSGSEIMFYLNYTKDTMAEVGGMIGTNDNYQELVLAERVPAAVTAADVAGSWNLIQFGTPSQAFIDGSSILQGGSNFGVMAGTMTVNANGTASGTLDQPFTGTYTIASGGIIHVNIVTSDGNTALTFILNAGKDTMTEVSNQFNLTDNNQEIVVAHRVPAN